MTGCFYRSLQTKDFRRGSRFMKRSFVSLLAVFFLFSCSNIEKEKRVDADSIQETVNRDPHFIPQEEALQIAENFFQNRGENATTRTGATPQLVGTDLSCLTPKTGEPIREMPAYYIYELDNRAFVIVAATKAAFPVLGYSFEGSFEYRNMPLNLAGMLVQYRREIDYLRAHKVKPSAEIAAMRQSGLRSQNPVGEIRVDALLKDILWNQSPHYNAYCPEDTPVGCVATATSMIMRYWEYPSSGVGEHGYFHDAYGLLEADFNHSYNWSKMPKSTLKQFNHDVAQLSYDVAVAVEMNFAPGGSGTYQTMVPGVLKKYFKYPVTVTNAVRDDYSEDVWDALIKKELDQKRPVQYAGSGFGGGHSFVCDGYDSKNYFHINWGWGGSSNGWFKLNALDPSDLGTGGGDGGFNYYQYAVINFMPPATVKGDDNTPIGETEPNGEKVIMYETVSAYSSKPLYIRYTCFNGMETFSHGEGYQKFLKSMITVEKDLKLNYAASVEIVDPTLENRSPFIGIWIDWDRNGIFDAKKELVASEKSTELKGVYTLPEIIKPGKYRLRTVVRKDKLADPNTSFLYGEVEDYFITVK